MKSSSQAGYTIIELLVVFAIISVIMLITLFQYSTFSSSTLLTNLTYEVALSIRQAQVYGLSVKGTKGGAAAPYSNATYNAGYGIHLDAVHPSGNLITSMVLFTDLPASANDTRPTGDRKFNYSDPPVGTGPAGSPEFLEQVSVPGGYLIQKFCGFYGATGTAYRCSDGTSSDASGGITAMDVVFQRPNPGAFFRDSLGNTAYGRVEITIYSLRNTSLARKAVVESTGQISVQ